MRPLPPGNTVTVSIAEGSGSEMLTVPRIMTWLFEVAI
jgi:hypothetical protein